MVTIGYTLSKGILRGHHKVDDLIEYAGPVLSLYRDEDGNPLLRFWVTHDDAENRWLIVPVTFQHVNLYLARQKSLREVLLDPLGGAVLLVDTDEEQNPTKVTLLQAAEIPSEYLPRENSYYGFEQRIYSHANLASKSFISMGYPELSQLAVGPSGIEVHRAFDFEKVDG